MTSDPDEEQALRSLLVKYRAERDRLDAKIALVAEELGEVPPDGPTAPPPGPTGGGAPSGTAGIDPVAATVQGQYLDMTSTKAALDVLNKYGSKTRPLSTKQLFDAIKKGGVKIGSEDSLYRSLHRSRRFRRAGQGVWGLAEWYPKAGTKGRATAPDNVSSLPPNGGGAEVSDEENTEVESA